MAWLPLLLWISLSSVVVQDPPDPLLERLKTDDPAERAKALDELRARGSEAVPPALRCLEGATGDFRERVRALVRGLSSEKWKERDESARALVALGRAAVPALQERTESGDSEVEWRLKAVLAEIGERKGRDERLELARNVALCGFLGEAGDPRAVRTLAGLLAGAAPSLRLAAAEALGRLRDRMEPAAADEAAERVLEALADPGRPLDGTEKARFIRVLAQLRSPSCVRPLAALLADRTERNVHVKRLAAAALAAAGDAAALRALVEALSAEDVYLRREAAGCLSALAGEGFGYDPTASPEANRGAVLKFRAWWSRKSGREWEP
jgi:HEAT repeat protein